jgi:hypothetical protein
MNSIEHFGEPFQCRSEAQGATDCEAQADAIKLLCTTEKHMANAVVRVAAHHNLLPDGWEMGLDINSWADPESDSNVGGGFHDRTEIAGPHLSLRKGAKRFQSVNFRFHVFLTGTSL